MDLRGLRPRTERLSNPIDPSPLESLITDQLPSLPSSLSFSTFFSFSRSREVVLKGIFLDGEALDRDRARVKFEMSECEVRGWRRAEVTLSRVPSDACGGLIKDFAYSCCRISI